MLFNPKLFKEKLSNQLANSTYSNVEVLQLLARLIKELYVHANLSDQCSQEKQVYYFSMEFLPGRFIETNLLNLDLLDICKDILLEYHYAPRDVFQSELDAALGNGGLGRLASCFLDSLAALNYAGHGMGLRYQYGLFEQKMKDNHQIELPDRWLGQNGYEWEELQSNESVIVQFGGRVHSFMKNNRLTFELIGTEQVKASPYHIPIFGFQNQRINSLTVWKAEAIPYPPPIEFEAFSKSKRHAEQLTEFLYPDDTSYEGKVLRLRQQYFLVSAGIQQILSQYINAGHSLSQLPEKRAMQINDTHPALIIPELMRLLIDHHLLDWEEAWKLTTQVMSYTNHTLMNEALETWPVFLLKEQLPRIYQIIEEINRRLCEDVLERGLSEGESIDDIAIIIEEDIHMARLATIGSHKINGVAKLHSSILKNQLMKAFSTRFPERFTNKTNGISHRQWLMNANPLLSDFISSLIGESWKTAPHKLESLLSYQDDLDVLTTLADIKTANKNSLITKLRTELEIDILPTSLFDVQIKRLHGYKRQLLNLLHILYLWDLCHEKPDALRVPRTFIFAAKAAPGYHYAKRIISLIAAVAKQINQDKKTKGKLGVVFLPNYSVSQAEWIIPAADLSEQISTASKEASGTGNMKMMMNGALTIGTRDGANIEMAELVSNENIFEFGMAADEVIAYEQNRHYSPRDIFNQDIRLQKALSKLVDGTIHGDEVAFQDIYYSLLYRGDEFFLLKDFGSYVHTQSQAENQYLDSQAWQKKCLINIAHSGYFSSDRTIAEYASEIWGLT
ncbi:glycogen/starch/alpha-glucan phosphorylase [Alkalicoccobacillus porphyridii]|uniref:Alpha-1,4 glucan phosphorylase n=1 Tax=Alkalicoccobacillus porphyridii TaxID=2597270 RepID=A0A553ZWK8_9BACI|nr:glycogen/starch/alpha-glucan phosphorylase [Alkalicoccobacillus porphyridii]TSB45823.1 glycogen/starch/alpha-glucan phosphorylase [Alkalicoccobacillus porphyridii]